jgi:three-Cys-motif partner protein
MASKKKLWPREPHTEGKHLVLRKYLDAWLPIMGRWNGRILLIDGFAGPGEYEGGEAGSPIIALEALIANNAQRVISAEVVFVFIEKDEERAEHLKGLVAGLRARLPRNVQVHVEVGEFDTSMKGVLRQLEEQKAHLAPGFVMLDPFGVSGTPFEVVARLLANPKSEVYISFMYEAINRFITTPEFAPHLDELFGTPDWRHAVALAGEERKAFLYSIYETQLRHAGAEHVVHFDLLEGNRLVYSIFFATRHWKGCDMMKQAIWGVAPFGDFKFVGTRSGQLVLGMTQPNVKPLEEIVCAQFGGAGWIRIEEVVEFVGSDATEYHTGHLKRTTLKPMEDRGAIIVQDGTRNRRGTYPDGTVLQFVC